LKKTDLENGGKRKGNSMSDTEKMGIKTEEWLKGSIKRIKEQEINPT